MSQELWLADHQTSVISAPEAKPILSLKSRALRLNSNICLAIRGQSVAHTHLVLGRPLGQYEWSCPCRTRLLTSLSIGTEMAGLSWFLGTDDNGYLDIDIMKPLYRTVKGAQDASASRDKLGRRAY